MNQWRVQFDAEVTFANGGALQAQEFRLDVPGPEISDTALGELFVRHLGLLMVGGITIHHKQMLQEPHKGSRGTAGAEPERGQRRLVDLSDASTRLNNPDAPLSRLVDLPGLVVRVLGRPGQAIERGIFLPYDVTGKAVLIHTGSDHAHLTADAAQWLAAQQPALIGTDSPNPGPFLLAAAIPIVAPLHALEQLPPFGFRFHAAPIQNHSLVRVYALVGEES